MTRPDRLAQLERAGLVPRLTEGQRARELGRLLAETFGIEVDHATE